MIMKTKLPILFLFSFLYITFLQAQTGINNYGAKIIINQGANVIIDGEQTGNFHNNYHLDKPGVLLLNGKLLLKGHWIENVTTPAISSYSTMNGMVVFNGNSATQNINGEGQPIFSNIKIENPYHVTALGAVAVRNSIDLATGSYIQATGELLLGCNIAFPSDPQLNPILLTNDATIIKQITDGENQSVSVAFPVKHLSASGYEPVQLSFENADFNGAFVSLQIINQKHTMNTSSTGFLSKYWNFSHTGISNMNGNALLTFSDEDVYGNLSDIYGAAYINDDWKIMQQATTENTLNTTFQELGIFTGLNGAEIALEQIQNYASQNDASKLTVTELKLAGVEKVVTTNLDEYKKAVAEEEAIESLEALQNLVNEVNLFVDLPEGNYKNMISVYPNPSANMVNFTLKNLKNKLFTLTIRSVTGKVVLQKKYATNCNHSLPVSHYPAGLYLMEFETVNHKIIKKIAFE